MKDIAVPSAELRAALSASGWRIAQVEEPDAWWIRERWHLRSEWSPQDTEAFITFLVDPQDSHPGNSSRDYRDVWAIAASTHVSTERMDAESAGHLVSLGGKWKHRIPELVSYLNNVRCGRAI
jgi:hypothetical protein